VTSYNETGGLKTLRNAFGRADRWSSGAALKLLLLFNVVFNLTDLTTSFIALQAGFAEANTLVLSISATLGLNVLESLVLMKILFFAGVAVVALMGTRSTAKSTKNITLGFLLTSALIFLVVSLSNIRWIVS
jgi:hypothetical protein